jgi:membrane-bound acyltransferase YfiQ involved in biofilm formation
MVGVMIIISSLILGLIVFKITKTKFQKLILTLLSIVLYAFLVFFIGMGLGSLFYVFATLPVIIGVILIIREWILK